MMEPRLKKAEAIAGGPNTCRAFSIPITSAASDTIKMKGNMIRVSNTVSSAFSAGKPGARMSEHRRKHDAEQRNGAHENERERGDLAGEVPGRALTFSGDASRERGHER